VLTVTSHSYGKAKNSTPYRIETPNLIEMKFGTVDYVGEVTPSAKFHAIPSMGASRQMGKIYAQSFYLHMHLLTVAFKDLHIKNSKKDKKGDIIQQHIDTQSM